ncbi:MAG: site-2 protease family protein [Clostridia bacterium]|nr:site-2 protease family protein [Clostridia bacterium]
MLTLLYVLLALLVFGLLIMIHELGHFLVARACGVGIREFSIGMGPKIFSWKGKKSFGAASKPNALRNAEENGEAIPLIKTEQDEETVTQYSLRAFPIGGYVSMVGEDEESDLPTSFQTKKVWQRILIVLAGPVMNVLLGFLLMTVLVLSTPQLASTTIGAFNEGATSPQYGLQIGDRVTHVNGTRVFTGNELVYEILNDGYEPVDLTVVRNGETLELADVIFPSLVSEGVNFGSADFRVYAEQKSFGNIVKHSFSRSVSTVKMIFDQLGDMIGGRYGMNAVSGPVGVTEGMVTAAKSGATDFLYLVIVITVNLGVFNLLPIPALDGGRLLFLVVEGVTRKPVNKNIEGYIHFAGLMILLALMAVIFCKDIAGLFVR